MLALTDLSVRVWVKQSTLTQVKQGLQAQYVQSFGEGASPGEELDVARYRVAQLDKSLRSSTTAAIVCWRTCPNWPNKCPRAFP